jgi:hypothetical protein
MARSLVPVTYYLYRNDVLIATGLMGSSMALSYQPPDASPAVYRVTFAPLRLSGNGATSTVGARSMELGVYRR